MFAIVSRSWASSRQVRPVAFAPRDDQGANDDVRRYVCHEDQRGEWHTVGFPSATDALKWADEWPYDVEYQGRTPPRRAGPSSRGRDSDRLGYLNETRFVRGEDAPSSPTAMSLGSRLLPRRSDRSAMSVTSVSPAFSVPTSTSMTVTASVQSTRTTSGSPSRRIDRRWNGGSQS